MILHATVDFDGRSDCTVKHYVPVPGLLLRIELNAGHTPADFRPPSFIARRAGLKPSVEAKYA